MLTIIILAAASFAFFGVAAGIAVNSVLDPKETMKAIGVCVIAAMISLGFAGHRLATSHPQIQTPNTNFNQLP